MSQPAESLRPAPPPLRYVARLFTTCRAVSAFCIASMLCTASAVAAPPDFKEEIQPLFAAKCAKCHGGKERDGGLRLSNRRDAFTPGDSGQPSIVPGKPAESLLIARVTSGDASERMPQEADPLTAAEIDLLTRWIAAGAVWPQDEGPQHWAYVPPQRPTVPPAPSQPAWGVNAVDQFVLAKLAAAGLKPQPLAEKARQLRRASLALVGLPPTVAEVDAFLADERPQAYEAAVDRLLASPRYGERWAQPWLDLARYADSNGYQADQLRDSWAYRDWVIDAMNRDQPFDQFVIEQLAGDMLPDATVAQKIATGFHRTVTCNVEAGVHPEENRVNQVFDRVNTTGTVFLGTTMECAQCHNHKYDPFTQEDYYRLFAYFNNTPLEVKQTAGVTYDFIGPKLALPLPPEKLARRKVIEQQLAELKAKRADVAETAAADRQQVEQAWKTAQAQPPQWVVLPIAQFSTSGGEDFKLLEDHSALISGSLPGTSEYVAVVQTKLTNIRGFKLETLTHETLPGTGPGRGDDVRANFVLNEFTIKIGAGDTARPVVLRDAEADFSQEGWSVAGCIDGDRATGWAIAPQFYKPHWASFRTEAPLGDAAGITLTFTLDQNFGRGRTIGRVRLSALIGEAAPTGVPDEIVQILQQEKPSAKEQKTLDVYFAAQNPALKELEAEVKKLESQLAALQPPTTLVMVEMDQARETHLFVRGNYLEKGRIVTCGTPSIFPPPSAEWPQNRLGLAKWITSSQNPLLARVTVNRWWAEMFGRGLVETPEDFGTQSDPPSHPELLDWLSVEFRESGWSMKHMHKLMAMSAAFRQSASATPAEREADPVNKLYSRGPRYRLPAEMIRDNGLAIAGLLSTKMAGPPVMPYQPDGIWRSVGRNSPKWVAETDEDRFRRGIYVVWRRAAPYCSFVNFDAPDRASCLVQRPRTNTPLQALTLLNDPAYVEMAVGLAVRMAVDRPGGSTEEKATYGFGRAVSRRPKPAELQALVALYDREHARFQAQPAQAQAVLAGAKSVSLPRDVKPEELAAWFFVASVLLNLDETVTN